MKGVDYSNDERRQKGRFFTLENPFRHEGFYLWAMSAGLGLPDSPVVLEPMAGAGDIIRHLNSIYPGTKSAMFDIEPRGEGVIERDTFKSFPLGFRVCVMNPPWLGKSNAQKADMREGAALDKRYDNLYAKALGLALERCQWVAALVPASFLLSNIYR